MPWLLCATVVGASIGLYGLHGAFTQHGRAVTRRVADPEAEAKRLHEAAEKSVMTATHWLKPKALPLPVASASLLAASSESSVSTSFVGSKRPMRKPANSNHNSNAGLDGPCVHSQPTRINIPYHESERQQQRVHVSHCQIMRGSSSEVLSLRDFRSRWSVFAGALGAKGSRGSSGPVTPKPKPA